MVLRFPLTLKSRKRKMEIQGKGKKKKTGKEKRGIQGFLLVFPVFLGGKRRKRVQIREKKGSNERKKGIKWQEMLEFPGKVPGKCCGSSRIVIPIPACSSPGAFHVPGALIPTFPRLDF